MEVYFNINQDLYMLDTVMEGLMKTIIKYAPIAMKEPENYEARANLMWTSSWAINGFVNGGKRQAWSCHPMEHEISAYYDITHGIGLAILTPRWMEYTLDETTVSKFYQFGCNVFGIDASLPQVEVAKTSIEMVKEFLYQTLELQSTFTEIGIDDSNFEIMAKKAVVGGGLAYAFKPLNEEDVVNIFKMCL
jgi:alcohol dehydrogenase YqhD (iron-dependent ADH family)